jgi:bacterioferritin
MPGNDRRNAGRGGRRARAGLAGGRVESAPAGAAAAAPRLPQSGTDTPQRGDNRTLEFLNLVLKNELTAVNQYFLHARMLDDWGVRHLGKHEYDESIDEMKHADRLIQRILFLGGLPNLQYLDKLLIGENVREVIVCDLALEEKARADLLPAIAHTLQVGDHVTRMLFERILESEEEHIDYLETQLRLIESTGIQNYIQSNSGPNAPGVLKGSD